MSREQNLAAQQHQVARFQNGLIVERWGSTDELGVLSQLGVEPKP